MRICFVSDHKYPGKLHGRSPHMVHDDLVKGLAELGHEVFYYLSEKPNVPLPEGVMYVPSYRYDVDILQINYNDPTTFTETPENQGLPWVRTMHIDIRLHKLGLDAVRKNWIHVSQSLARTHGSERYVYNGINPDEFIYSGTKADYLLFVVSGVHRAKSKGLDTALDLAQKTGVPLWVAGSHADPGLREAFERHCQKEGAVSIGEITGTRKAEVFAGAKALLFPTQLNEAFGLVAIEALMSGTPVIGSNLGAVPELLDASTGFVCESEQDYIHAIENCGKIKPQDCRKAAMERFHYLKMSEEYVQEYQREIGQQI